ncbi:Ig domain-containing protein, partial [Winogradskyella sp. A2]|uniref:Ig-like domain-containing protein n=1 Tax=Winogradskyella sp. A2 TaxID=3366944 RepID=UPI00398C3583
TSIDQGVWDVQGGTLLLSSVSSGSTAVWSSEPIDITGHENVTISIDVDDLDDKKENSDYVEVFYRLDGGSLIPFGTVTGNIDLTNFTVSGITGSVLELVVETQVSFLDETYSIDNVNVSGTPTVPIAVSSVTLSPSTISVELGDNSQQLTATVNPSNADDTSVSWLSSDESVAMVDENGFITPVAVGEATITVTTTDGGFQDTSIVTIIEEVIVPVTGITLSPSDATMNIGGATLLLEATVLPFDASDQSVTWSTSDASVASVDINGEVTANSEGVAVITVTTTDGNFVSNSTINVIAIPTDLPWVEDFEDLADGTTIDTG